MPRQINIVVISCAASYFARESRNLTEIAATFDVSERTVRRWSQEAAWDEALDVWGYNDDRSFEVKPKRDAQRDAPELFGATEQAYIHAFLEGIPRHKIARIVVELVKAKKVKGSDKLTPKRVRQWAKVYGWTDHPEETDPAEIHCAAAYYVFNAKDERQIAKTFKTTAYQVNQWIKKHPEWYKALKICGFTPPKKPDIREEPTPLIQKTAKPSPKASDTKLESLSGFDGWAQPDAPFTQHHDPATTPSRQRLVKAT